ncbi:MAG: hypothetical protein ACREX3_15870, partial [Gammaproteobacteria bacterium]
MELYKSGVCDLKRRQKHLPLIILIFTWAFLAQIQAAMAREIGVRCPDPWEGSRIIQVRFEGEENSWCDQKRVECAVRGAFRTAAKAWWDMNNLLASRTVYIPYWTQQGADGFIRIPAGYPPPRSWLSREELSNVEAEA